MRAQLLEALKAEDRKGFSWLNEDETCLAMHSHLVVAGHDFGHDDDAFDALFDALQLYSTLTSLTIHHDGFHSIPLSLQHFYRLRALDIQGSRLWDVDLRKLPEQLVRLKIRPNGGQRMDVMWQLHRLPDDIEHLDLAGYDDPDWPVLPVFDKLRTVVVGDFSYAGYLEYILPQWLKKYESWSFDRATSTVSSLTPRHLVWP